jgi:type III secretion system low calcium response chaperone LcrH/SycD
MDYPEELKIPDDTIEQLQKPDVLRKYIEEGKSLQDIIGYSNELMQKLYSAAYDIFQEGRYQESQDAFLFLTTLNPYVYAYWLGLAMSYQFLEEYEQAVLAYECASSVEPDRPFPYYYRAGCHYLLNEKTEALYTLDLLEEKSSVHPEEKELFEKGKKLRERIKGL